MGYSYYSRLIMIPASVEVNFDEIHSKIEEAFARSKHFIISRPSPNKIEITFNEWTYHIAWGIPYPEDVQVISETDPERSDIEIIASSTRTINIWGDPDPNMNHFDTYLIVLGVIEEIPDVYHYDNFDGNLWKSGEDPFETKDDSTNQNP
jgi:hypothetical protein